MGIAINGSAEVAGDYDAVVAEINPGNYAILASIKQENAAQTVIEDAIAGNAYPVPVYEEIIVTINGIILSSAGNPQIPQSHEYVYNSYTNEVSVYQSGVLVVSGRLAGIPVYPPLLSSFPWLFTSLPLEGQISINRTFEQHPSADFEFETIFNKSSLLAALYPGLEVDIYGIPLRINSISVVELPRAVHPDGRCRVSISFGGKWENYLDRPCFLRSDGKNLTGVDEPFQDSECQINSSSESSKSQVAIATLLTKIGVPYFGLRLKPVEVPPSTPRDATVNPIQLLQERVRVAYGFEFYSNSAGVEVRRIGGQKVWNYHERDILGEVQTSYDAISKNSKNKLLSVSGFNPPRPDTVNFPATFFTPYPTVQLRQEVATNLYYEYPNSELTGGFQDREEDAIERTQGQVPRWIKKEPSRITRIEGDKEAHVPLEGVELVQVMSLCFDIGGQTKTRTFVTEENGTRVEEIEEIWGFAYTANSIYDDASKTLRGGIGETWRLLKQVKTTYTYEKNTGYLIYITQNGFNTVRFQQETADKPETLSLPNGSNKFSLYEFFRIPVVSRTSYLLRLMPDWSSEGLFDLVKVCERNGTSRTEVVFNPNYAPAYYVEVERSESSSFARRSNPANDNISETRKRQPDLIVGEESRFQSIIEIIPGVYQEIYTGESAGNFPVVQRGEELQPQKYVKYTRKFKAQGQAIAEALEEVFVEEQQGNPPVAQRRADLYYKQEIPQDNQNNQEEEDQYRYFLQTAGYTYQDPIGGSESFPVAETLQEALTGARAKLAIENWRQGFSEQLQIPGNLNICEGDRFNYFCNGEMRQRVVLGVQHQLQILGEVGGVPKVTCVTSLQLGRYVLPSFNWNRVQVPLPGSSPVNITVTNVINENLGNLIDWLQVISRRKP